MDTKHTPGPWGDKPVNAGREGSYQDFKIFGPDGKVICACSANSSRSNAEIYANAKLIASAPEMAEEITRLREANAGLKELAGDLAEMIREYCRNTGTIISQSAEILIASAETE